MPERSKLKPPEDLVQMWPEIKNELACFAPDLELESPGDEWELCLQGQLAEDDILTAYVNVTGLTSIDPQEFDNLARTEDLELPYLLHWKCIPVTQDQDHIVLAVAQPYDLATLKMHWINLLQSSVEFVLARRSVIERAIEQHYGKEMELGGADEEDEHKLKDIAQEAPIVRLVNDLFARAIEVNASDIHVEPSETVLTVRFRVDGVLQTINTYPMANFPAIASRLKLIGNLNIAERRLPQDGRTNIRIGRADLDVRISTLPMIDGESIVLRILRKDINTFAIDNIGLPSEVLDNLRNSLGATNGMILVVGPTGSGKTTTLYCALNEVDASKLKIITVEDPVEYKIQGVTQVQVQNNIGLSFSSALRHIVRQDPDVILVGEIRDRETAEIAVHSALTGHLVLSTLHTNDAAGTIARLQDMGIENFLISSSVIGILSQRLVRVICPTCKGKPVDEATCKTCHGEGFSGRTGIYEFLLITDTIREAIKSGADRSTIDRIARDQGMLPLQLDGRAKVKEGITTLQEVARVCS